MTLQEFYDKYNGKSNVGNTAVNRGECVGLSSLWMDNFNVPHVYGHAKDLYANAPDEYFAKIPNTPDAIVQEGDIVVWGQGYNGTFGHTGVAKGKADVSSFECFQQNDPLGSKPHIKRYNYSYVIGWLRPKNPAIITQPIAQQPQITDNTPIPLNMITQLESYNSPQLQEVKSKLLAKDASLYSFVRDFQRLSDDFKKYKETHPEVPVEPKTPVKTLPEPAFTIAGYNVYFIKNTE